MVFLWFSYGFPMVFQWESPLNHDEPGEPEKNRRPVPQSDDPILADPKITQKLPFRLVVEP